MQQIVQISIPAHNGLYDITRQVEAIVGESGIDTGLVNVYAQWATSAIMIGFNMIGSLFAKLIIRNQFRLFRHPTDYPEGLLLLLRYWGL